jgi:hypothetical protein
VRRRHRWAFWRVLQQTRAARFWRLNDPVRRPNHFSKSQVAAIRPHRTSIAFRNESRQRHAGACRHTRIVGSFGGVLCRMSSSQVDRLRKHGHGLTAVSWAGRSTRGAAPSVQYVSLPATEWIRGRSMLHFRAQPTVSALPSAFKNAGDVQQVGRQFGKHLCVLRTSRPKGNRDFLADCTSVAASARTSAMAKLSTAAQCATQSRRFGK